jgi:LysM repeat protein
MTKRLILKGFAALAVVAGCTVPSERKPVEINPAAPSTEETETGMQPEGQSSTPGTQGQQGTGPGCIRALPAPGPAAQKEVFRLIQQARVLLNDGEEDKARAELECAQQMDNDNKQVACLLRGITVDLSSAQAGDSTPYTVRSGETLGSIAQRFLGDSCEFYMLSRFNKMKSPKQLPVGQLIRLPGRINIAAPPPPQPQPPVTAAPARPVPVPAPPRVEAPPPPPPVEVVKKQEPSPETRRAEVERHYRRGLEAYRRQNLGAAISAYDAVLALDPNHGGARVGRQQAFELQEKLKGIPK